MKTIAGVDTANNTELRYRIDDANTAIALAATPNTKLLRQYLYSIPNRHQEAAQ